MCASRPNAVGAPRVREADDRSPTLAPEDVSQYAAGGPSRRLPGNVVLLVKDGATSCVPVAPAQRRRAVVIQVAEAKVTPSAVRWTAVVARRASRATARPASSRPSSNPAVAAEDELKRVGGVGAEPEPSPRSLEDLRNHPVSEPQTHLPARDVAITARTRGPLSARGPVQATSATIAARLLKLTAVLRSGLVFGGRTACVRAAGWSAG